MDFDEFVDMLYGGNAFDDENSEYVKKWILPFLIPALEKLVRLVDDEKEKHSHFALVTDTETKIINEMPKKKKGANIAEVMKTEPINIFDTDVLQIKPAKLYEIQQEVLKKSVNGNPILLLRYFLLEEYNKQKETKNDDTVEHEVI